jgi:hypothetical protein
MHTTLARSARIRCRPSNHISVAPDSRRRLPAVAGRVSYAAARAAASARGIRGAAIMDGDSQPQPVRRSNRLGKAEKGAAAKVSPGLTAA